MSTMRNALILQLDGKIPNLALLRIAAHHRRLGHAVDYRHAHSAAALRPGLFDPQWDWVYASAIFDWSKPLVENLLAIYPGAVVGGTGWDKKLTLTDAAIREDEPPDYSDHAYSHSIGFTQRGCRLKCSFCVVPTKEPVLKRVSDIFRIWRGDPWPRNLLLLDNDFFGQPDWQQHIEDIRAGGFKVCWNQGFNVRLINDEHAAAIATVDYRCDQFKDKRLYTAWDNRGDEKRLFRNLEVLKQHGVRPDNILVYMLIGYWHGPQLHADDHYRRERLREFGCRPYPMPYVKTRELQGFQRWCIRRADLMCSWSDWVQAGYRADNMEAA